VNLNPVYPDFTKKNIVSLLCRFSFGLYGSNIRSPT